jgi:hypothetical protein
VRSGSWTLFGFSLRSTELVDARVDVLGLLDVDAIDIDRVEVRSERDSVRSEGIL